MYIEIFLKKHIWIAVVIAVLLIISEVKSIIRKMRK
jgi:hypothetical protein